MTEARPLARHIPRLVLVLIILLAALLRFYQLDAQSFWHDEGNSARLAERTLQSITVGTASDIHPPLYYYALHFWRAAFGCSEFALRALSAAAGVLLVWMIYLIGRQLFDEPTALAAALIAAVNPFQIYYSQEARMYALQAMWAAVSTHGLLQIFPATAMGESANLKSPFLFSHLRPSTFHFILFAYYVLASAAGLYTQYTFAFVLIVHNLFVLVRLIAEREGWLRRGMAWAAAQAAIVILYLPWLPVALSRTRGWGIEPETYQLGAALLDVARLFAYGVTLPTAQAGAGLVATGLLVLAGLWPGKRAEAAWPTGLLALWWLVPVALMFGIGLYREAYLKFLLMSSAPVCLLAARGAVNAWRAAARYRPFQEMKGAGSPAQAWQGFVLSLAVLAAMPLPQSLLNLYFDPAYARDDYRGIAQFVRRTERAGDAVLLIAPNQWEVFTYYYTDAERVYAMARSPDPVEADAELRRITAKHPRLFVVYWGDFQADPHRVYESWLGKYTYKTGDEWWGDVRVAMYVAPLAAADTPQHSLDVRFGDAITLLGYTLLTPQLSAGGAVQLALFWQASAPIAERYKVFVHVLDAGGRIVAQVDREPGVDLAPTTIWKPGEMVIDRYGVPVPVDAPGGTYTLVVGLYDFGGARLPITQGGQGDALHLSDIEVR